MSSAPTSTDVTVSSRLMERLMNVVYAHNASRTSRFIPDRMQERYQRLLTGNGGIPHAAGLTVTRLQSALGGIPRDFAEQVKAILRAHCARNGNSGQPS